MAAVELLLAEEALREPQPGLEALKGAGGVGAALEGDVREAWAGLAVARSQWLRWEGLWAGLQELLRQDPPGFREVEQRLAESQLRRGPPPMTSLPPPQDPAPLLRLLLPALERHLELKAASLADYHGGGAGGRAPGGVARALANERRRLGHAHRRGHALRELLSQQRRLLPPAVGRVRALLGLLAQRGGQRAARDERRGRLLENRARGLLLKSRLEELRLLLDTYGPQVVEAHGTIRSLLQAESSRAAEESSRLRGALCTFRSLGPGFEAQAREYGRLRQRLRQRQWALGQLRPRQPSHSDPN